MHWNHRVVRSGPAGDKLFAIHEVYYNDKDAVTGRTENPTAPVGSSKKELRRTLRRMLRALDKPVIED